MIFNQKFDSRETFDYQKNSEEFCCKNPNIVQTDGFLVCTNCGLQHERIFAFYQSSAFNHEEKIKKLQNEKIHSQIGPRTIIKGLKDGKGSDLKPKNLLKFKRLAKINRDFINGFENNLFIAMPTFYRLKFGLNLPNYVSKDAFIIYRYIVKNKLTKGRNIEALTIASIFAALKINGIPRTLEEIANFAQISKNLLLNSYNVIKLMVLPNLNLKVKVFSPHCYVNKLMGILNLSMKCRNIAIAIINKSYNHGLNFSGKDPKGIAAASVYMASKFINETRIQRQICSVLMISETTLRERMKELKKYFFPNIMSQNS
ncbi:MAG: hypothetical protein EU532_09725 [Promethearchaeota archaeon]|nr:MAG: hypothetical protein EU532_09725 [Candidatus Lokiarchaeota archaeon]